MLDDNNVNEDMTIWIDSNGKKWNITDMSTRYLQNVIYYLDDNADNFYDYKRKQIMQEEIDERLKREFHFYDIDC